MTPSAKAQTVWVLFMVGITAPLTVFIGIILAYIWGSTNTAPGVAGHNAAQKRLFWRAFMGWMVAISIIAYGFYIGITYDLDELPTISYVGVLVGFAVQIIFTIQSLIGLVRAIRERNWPGSNPQVFGSDVYV